ncbi:MAG: hypothetical protein IPJ88_13440 [Myxococcales bacterium]|nr:MAG: hypothetical protein IPJ88_13440 [Myxococcales bacterium]
MSRQWSETLKSIAYCVLLFACGCADCNSESLGSTIRATSSSKSYSKEDKVVSEVNGTPIYLKELKDILSQTEGDPRQSLRLLEDELLLGQHASNTKAVKNKSVLHAQKQALVQHLLSKQVEEKFRAERVPLELVEALYRERADQYDRPKLYTVAHVLVKTESNASPAFDRSAKEYIVRIIARLKGKSGA